LGVALAVTLPMGFHQIGLGPAFLPMHLPILLTGALAGPWAGFLAGSLAPAISHLLTGMPPVAPPIAPLMTVELAVYGLASGLARRTLLSKRTPDAGRRERALIREYLWLGVALAAGRAALALAAIALGPTLGLRVPPLVYLKGAYLTGLPGLVIQFAVIPALVMRLRATGRPEEGKVTE
jgi:niacin transporter